MSWGGARPGAGKKPIYSVKMGHITLALNASQKDKLKRPERQRETTSYGKP